MVVSLAPCRAAPRSAGVTGIPQRGRCTSPSTFLSDSISSTVSSALPLCEGRTPSCRSASSQCSRSRPSGCPRSCQMRRARSEISSWDGDGIDDAAPGDGLVGEAGGDVGVLAVGEADLVPHAGHRVLKIAGVVTRRPCLHGQRNDGARGGPERIRKERYLDSVTMGRPKAKMKTAIGKFFGADRECAFGSNG